MKSYISLLWIPDKGLTNQKTYLKMVSWFPGWFDGGLLTYSSDEIEVGFFVVNLSKI